MLQAGRVIWKGNEIAELPGLSFSEAGHVYKLNGRQLKSVTGYTSKWSDHSFCDQVDLDWGSAVHDYLHKFDVGLLDFDSPEFDHRFDLYIDGWKAFCIKQGWDTGRMLAEYKLFSEKYFIAGRLDRLFETANHDYLIDIKSGQPDKITGMQLAAYGCMAIERGLTNASRLRLMECCISKDGKVRTQIFNYKTELNFFLMAYSLQNRYGK